MKRDLANLTGSSYLVKAYEEFTGSYPAAIAYSFPVVGRRRRDGDLQHVCLQILDVLRMYAEDSGHWTTLREVAHEVLEHGVSVGTEMRKPSFGALAEQALGEVLADRGNATMLAEELRRRAQAWSPDRIGVCVELLEDDLRSLRDSLASLRRTRPSPGRGRRILRDELAELASRGFQTVGAGAAITATARHLEADFMEGLATVGAALGLLCEALDWGDRAGVGPIRAGKRPRHSLARRI